MGLHIAAVATYHSARLLCVYHVQSNWPIVCAGIPKLDDANDAGGRNSDKCTLILTEGDSAKALAISGLSVVGRDSYGVFPLRGKLLNVRDASSTQARQLLYPSVPLATSLILDVLVTNAWLLLSHCTSLH